MFEPNLLQNGFFYQTGGVNSWVGLLIFFIYGIDGALSSRGKNIRPQLKKQKGRQLGPTNDK
jgi:hypothetical protein